MPYCLLYYIIAVELNSDVIFTHAGFERIKHGAELCRHYCDLKPDISLNKCLLVSKVTRYEFELYVDYFLCRGSSSKI